MPNKTGLVISNYLEENDLEIKKIFHETVNKFTYLKINNESVLDITSKLEVDLWNSSLLAEKSFYKTPEIFSFLKIIALKIFLKNKSSYSEINIYNCSKNEKNIIKSLFKDKRLKFNFYEVTSSKRKLRNFLPHYFQVLIWFCFKIFRLRGVKSKITIKNESKVLVFSTLSHLKIDLKQNVKIISRIWGELPEMFKTHNLSVKWLYYFTKSRYAESHKKAYELLNNNPNNFYQAHSLLVPLKKSKVLIHSIRLYVKYYIYLQLKFKYLNPKIDSLDDVLIKCYFKIFKFNFNDSFFGICAFENIFLSLTFDDILGSLNKQKLGLYINENQNWEYLFVKSWNKYNHGKLVSVQHSTVRFWDLRYYYREWLKDDMTANLISVNGNASKNRFLQSNYPKNKIIELESLRYNYLLNIKKIKNKGNSKNILVLGDILFSNTFSMIKVIEEIIKNDKYNFTFKSHPANIINPQLLKNFKVTSKNLNELFYYFDTIICPSSSGSSVDAFIVGIKVILYNDNEVNTSPLYGYSNLMSFLTKRELLDCLEKPNDMVNSQDFFYLNKNYQKWNQLLKNI